MEEKRLFSFKDVDCNGAEFTVDPQKKGGYTLNCGNEEAYITVRGNAGEPDGARLRDYSFLIFDVHNFQPVNEIFVIRFWEENRKASITVTIALFPQISARLIIHTRWLNGQILYPPMEPGALKISVGGSGIALNSVTAIDIGLAGGHCNKRKLAIRQAYWTNQKRSR